ncbi:MAG TPA: O-antigen ligase family protein [Terriglobales bacterium]|jgi:O-antigen ligase|nr:O-antigen ligase family protein [Terriglobales bacterium]
MVNNATKILFIVTGGALLIVCLLLLRPDYLASSSGLTLLIGAEILLAAACNFRKAFLPLALLCFLGAGSELPFQSELLQARWIVLAVGAVLGVAVFMKNHLQTFKLLHLVAFFCVLSAFVSALVSVYPRESLLKAISLLLLFLYVSAGARTALNRDPAGFFRKLVRWAEGLLIITVICYFVVRWEVFGNPNSLGAIMAVVILPLLLWGYLSAKTPAERLRLGADLLIALLLLFSSFARASIAAAFVSCSLICWSAREFRLLFKGIALSALLAILAVVLVPRHTDVPSWDGSQPIVDLFMYKGKHDRDVFGSRRGVWQKTWDVIREKPWFGSGFGTSEIDEDMTKLEYARHHFDSWVIREHGNSYLAIVEWTGLLGVLPFFSLVALVLGNAARTLRFVRRTCDVSSPAVPAVAVVLAGLVNATFEDWLFAVGYYVCVFFWCMAFMLADVMPNRFTEYSAVQIIPDAGHEYGAMAAVR